MSYQQKSKSLLGVVATHLRPAQGFGGVVESTSAMIEHWRRQEQQLSIVTSDGTLGPILTQSDFESALNGPVSVYKSYKWIKWGFGIGAVPKIARAIRASDRVYISGIATWPTTLAAGFAILYGKPFVVALRGGLTRDHWATICASKPLKKLFYRLFTFPALRRAMFVHVTSHFEAVEAQDILPDIKTFIAPNALSLPPAGEIDVKPAERGSLKLLFLGRLAPEKAILSFCQAIQPHLREGDELCIAGAPDGEYGQSVIAFCDAHAGYRYLGVLPRESLRRALLSCNMLILPSGFRGADIRENFGNVVVEALGCGRPVLVSAGLAWDGIETDGVGVLLDRSGDGLAETLARARLLVSDADIADRCLSYARRHFSIEGVCDRVWQHIFDGDSAHDQRSS